MLRKPEHGPDPVSEEAVPIQFLIAFIRNVIRQHPSGDIYYLAMASAKRMFPITKEQEQAFMKAVLHETKNSVWPQGFF